MSHRLFKSSKEILRHRVEPVAMKMDGKYFGTEIDEKWWKRYTKQKMLARGNGVFSYDNQSIFFHRKLTEAPITINFHDILALKTGSWHAGQWGAGNEILKVIWKKEGRRLSSGFAIAKYAKTINELIQELDRILASSQN